MEEKVKLIGIHLKMLRIRRKMQQKELAQRIGISQAHLSCIESGHCYMKLEHLFKLQEVFGCPISDFFAEVDEKFMDKEHALRYEDYTLEDIAKALVILSKL